MHSTDWKNSKSLPSEAVLPLSVWIYSLHNQDAMKQIWKPVLFHHPRTCNQIERHVCG